MKNIAILPLIAISLTGCPGSTPSDDAADSGVPETLFDYEGFELPEHFYVAGTGGMGSPSAASLDNTPGDNPTTNDGASLGRYLFYDVNLSANGTIACASCHKSEFGFSDDRQLSLGFEDGETGRHSMGLTNARFYAPGMFFWDQRADSLEEQVLMPFQDEVEMGMTLDTLVAAVQAQDHYAGRFADAFGTEEVTSDRISKALAQFIRSMVSFGSKYDEGRAQVASQIVDFPLFTRKENLGKQIFMNTPMGPNGAGCAVCHQGETFSAPGARNNGLDINAERDPGYGGVTERAADMATFKVPSLRNVAVRGSFMHDGRFSTLRQVVDHYGDTVLPNPNLGMPLNRHAGNLSPEHREALVAFLETLTDEAMLNDPKFSNPYE
jgi:cytochrome c peroxidase